jgi:preprotein translocase SecE subunit
VARDRKRAKQRRERRGSAVAGRERQGERSPRPEADQPIQRADVPGALDHASAEVDEFDAALVRGADGVPAADVQPEENLDGSEDGLDGSEDGLQELAPSGGGAGRGGPPGAVVAEGERPSGAPLRGGNRVIGFLRASWAELQRVQWPDRRQVTQATAVVLGFVAIAGAYLGAADFVANEIVEFILG